MQRKIWFKEIQHISIPHHGIVKENKQRTETDKFALTERLYCNGALELLAVLLKRGSIFRQETDFSATTRYLIFRARKARSRKAIMSKVKLGRTKVWDKNASDDLLPNNAQTQLVL